MVDGETLPHPSCPRRTVAPATEGGVVFRGGTFTMGAPAGDPTRAAYSEDQVVVTLTHAFEISQHEVTICEWREAGLSLSVPAKEPTGCSGTECPTFATWYDAMRFANALSAAQGPSSRRSWARGRRRTPST